MNTNVNDIIEPLVNRCRPFGVAVKLKTVKEKYYIHFDGTKSATSDEHWERYWGGFKSYIANILFSTKFRGSTLEIKNDRYVTVYIGTLFDFLTQAKEDENA